MGRRALWGLVLLIAIPSGTARSSPIRNHRLSARGVGQIHAWNTFLAGGPARWARVAPPTITTQIRAMMDRALASAHPMADPNVEYLMWRRSLNPQRFDYWHPRMGPQLQSLSPEVIGPVVTPGPVQSPGQAGPPATPTPPVPPPTTPDQPAPPEPGTSTPPDTPVPPSPGTTTPPPAIEVPPTNPAPSPEPIPEPETLVMGLVLLGSGLWWRRRNRRAPAGA